MDEDEAYLEQADRFEANYNFRFEEPGGAQIVGHPRRVEDAFRKEDNKRAAARKERSARKAEEEERRRQEVRRLKGLKKKEIEDRCVAARVAMPITGGIIACMHACPILIPHSPFPSTEAAASAEERVGAVLFLTTAENGVLDSWAPARYLA